MGAAANDKSSADQYPLTGMPVGMIVLLSAFGYFAFGLIGLPFNVYPSESSVVWPAAGFALAMVLLHGHWSLPGLLLGAAAINLLTFGPLPLGIDSQQLAAMILAKSFGVVVQAAFAAWLIRRVTGPAEMLISSRNIALFLFLGGPLGCLISPSMGVATIYSLGLVDASELLYAWINWWVGDTIGVLTLTPIFIVLIDRRSTHIHNRRYSAALPLALLLVLVMVLFKYVLDREQRLVEELFETRSGYVIESIQADTVTISDFLYALKGFFEASEEVLLSEFNEFTKDILKRRRDILAFNWYPQVTDAGRKVFERSLGHGFRITERDDQGQLVTARQRELYFPIAYIAPLAGNESAWGYDIASDAPNRRGLWETIDSNQLVATAPIKLQQRQNQHPGVVLRLPVFEGERPLRSPAERRAALRGLVSIVIQNDAFINSNPHRKIYRDLLLRITDTTPGEETRLVFSDPGFKERPVHGPTAQLRLEKPLLFGGRQWFFEMVPSADFRNNVISSGLWWILLGTTLLVMMASYTLLLLTGRFYYIEAQVEERTEEIRHSRALLEKSEHRFRSLFDQFSNIAIQGFDRDRKLIYWNQQSERLYGYSRQEVLGQDYTEVLVPAGIRQQTVFAINNWIQAGIFIPSAEQTRRHRDGSLVPVYSSYVMIDTLGGGKEIYCVDIDLSRLKAIEKNLDESEQRMMDIIDNTPVLIMAKDSEDRYTFANQQSAALLGMTVEEIQGKTIQQVFPVAQAEEFRTHDKIVMERGQAQVFEETMTIGGRDHVILANRFPLKHDNGDIYGVCLVATDITERKQDEIELRKLSMAVKHSPNAVFVTDTNAVIEYVNPKFCQVTGYSEDEVLGKEASILRSGNTDPLHYRQMWQALSRGEEWHGEYQNRRKDGTLYWAEEYIGPISDDEGLISHFVAIQQDVTEARRISEEMTYQATHDQLTGLINRQEFDRRLQRVLEQARQENSVHALCYLDLDQFKIVNDTSGHVAGDELLRQLSNLMSENLRKRDTLARLGGDEFGILMEHCPIEQAERVANQIRRLVEEFRFVWEERNYSIGVSIGLVGVDTHALNITEIMKQADSACYVAKSMGRNRIHVFTREDKVMNQHQGELEWVAQINHALDENRFRLFIQPIVPLNERGELPGCEVLLRLETVEGELVPPGAFLPAAERYNLSSRIDRWVIGACFNWLADHRQTLKKISSISINLSGTSLADDSLLEFVLKEFRQHDIPASSVKFEITETAAVANLTSARAFIHDLQEYGCEFALDDFGSGMSSFAYLKNLPVDYLKIDGMFVRDIIDDPIDRAMVRSINDIGQVMGMQTIAEFVENDDILDILRAIGVNYAQGYGVGRPAPIETLLDDDQT